MQMSFKPSLFLFLLSLLATPALACLSTDSLPDPACSPGAIDPRVTQENIHETICVPGYSKTVRPPVSVTNRIKKERMQAYGIAAPMNTVELDHLVPISSGGCVDCVSNLWPQSWIIHPSAHDKDRLEDRLHALICSNQITLQEAQTAIRTNWVEAYRKYLCTDERDGICESAP